MRNSPRPARAQVSGEPFANSGDQVGAASESEMTVVGLGSMAIGTLLLSTMPPTFALLGYIPSIAVVTSGYALFQAANNTAISRMSARADHRGVVSGMLSLSRNLGPITGASAMGALFALGSATTHILTASPQASRAAQVIAGSPRRTRGT